MQEPLASELPDEAHLDARELAGGRDHVDPVHPADDRVSGPSASGEHVDQVHAKRASLETQLPRQRKLRIGVDDENATAAAREQRRDVRRRRCLPNPALLICDRRDHYETSRRLV